MIVACLWRRLRNEPEALLVTREARDRDGDCLALPQAMQATADRLVASFRHLNKGGGYCLC